MMEAFDLSISWGELLKRTAKETNADDVFGLAAQLAYYFLLALVPAIVCLVALTGLLPGSVIDGMMRSAAGVMPPDILHILQDQVTSIRGGEHGGLLSFGLLMALWSSSAAMVAITSALNRAYDIDEGRPWWRVRLNALLLTVSLAAFVVTAFTLVVAGPDIAEALASRLGLGKAFTTVWNILQWPVAFLLVVIAVALINYLAPDADQDWVWITPGAVLATVLWLLASLGFRYYVTTFGNYNATYGSLGGVIVLLLYFYISGIAILVGAEMNAEIEHASPHGKDPGEKVPGERKKLGLRAQRAWDLRAPRTAPAPR